MAYACSVCTLRGEPMEIHKRCSVEGILENQFKACKNILDEIAKEIDKKDYAGMKAKVQKMVIFAKMSLKIQ